MIRSVREWTHSPDKESWGKELRDAEALFLCKKICYNGKNQLEAGHCSPTAQRRLVCVKTENFVNFFKSCPVQSETLAAFRRRRKLYRQAHLRRFGTLLQEKRVPKTDCTRRLISKIIRWMIFDQAEPGPCFALWFGAR